ncbi:MAG: hypothetical protein OEN56_15030 [Gemmatimonadota bacterium]|nr:hypothetical protein [Gemmatimonadota bacterium]
MSQPEGNESRSEASFARLEAAIGQLLDRLTTVRDRAEAAEAKNAELAQLVQRFTGNEHEAGQLMTRLKALEDENVELRGRLDRGRDGVDRMIARIRFLENQ